jgi:DNA-binding beta-propeller fold protein YncE
LQPTGRWRVGRHPSSLLLTQDGTRLFVASGSTDRVAVVETATGKVVKELLDPPPAGPHEGSTPNALALSSDGKRLYVAEADNNAIGVFDLSTVSSGVTGATGGDALAGRIPVGWYPTAVTTIGDSLFALNGKGRGTAPNVAYPQPGRGLHTTVPRTYTLGQLSGTLTLSGDARASGSKIAIASLHAAIAASGSKKYAVDP